MNFVILLKRTFLASFIRESTTANLYIENYYSWSPYAYVGNNPIKRIDPTGMDWWTTNDPEKIKAFLNSHGSGVSGHDFSGWDHHTEIPKDIVMFGFDDVAGQFHMIAGNVNKSFNSNILPVLGESGEGYTGAYVYNYSGNGVLYNVGYNAAQFGEISAFAAEFIAPFDPNNYFDGVNNWNVDTSGRLTGINNIQESKRGGGRESSSQSYKRSCSSSDKSKP